MNELYKNEIEDVEELLSDFYNITFSNEIEEFEKNRQNKMSLKNLIIKIANDLNISKQEKEILIDTSLRLLGKNTGCAEDSMIAEDILDELFYQRKIIDQKDLDQFYNYTSTRRWD